MSYSWFCECGHVVPFQTPVLPQDNPASELNGSKDCDECGGAMYFDEDEDEDEDE